MFVLSPDPNHQNRDWHHQSSPSFYGFADLRSKWRTALIFLGLSLQDASRGVFPPLGWSGRLPEVVGVNRNEEKCHKILLTTRFLPFRSQRIGGMSVSTQTEGFGLRHITTHSIKRFFAQVVVTNFDQPVFMYRRLCLFFWCPTLRH